MKSSKIREKLAALFAVIVLILFLAVGAHFAGWNIPGLSHIAKLIGLGA